MSKHQFNLLASKFQLLEMRQDEMNKKIDAIIKILDFTINETLVLNSNS